MICKLSNKFPLAITMGDPAGIGPEIIAKLYRASQANGAIVIGDVGTMQRACALIGGVQVHEIHAVGDAYPAGSMPVLQAGFVPQSLAFGKVSAEAGLAAYDVIITAIELAQNNQIAGIVTAPIHKESLKLAGIVEPGHTEILAAQTSTSYFGMMLANDELRVMLVSIHVPLLQAIALVTIKNVLNAIKLAHQGCLAFGVEQPRIAVAGLNPHAGENGQFGREEIEIIAPAIAAAKAQGFNATGPFAPDTIFMRARKQEFANRGEFDCVVAQYHDQGLIPVKYLGVDNGVNVTVGLPFVRTSVDHGTAFDLAGTGKANEASLVYALRVAERMVKP
jgi:4-hydroxythreonine-4-phosphate dehydrogenase